MKTFIRLCVLVGAVAAGSSWVSAQSGYDLFQKALAAERTQGDLREAIQLYERVVKDFAADRPLAARALVRIAECQERLGRGEATKVYERIVRDFPDQPDSVSVARARLSALTGGPGRTPGRTAQTGLATRQVWAEPDADQQVGGSITRDGRFLTVALWHETGAELGVRDLTTGETKRLTVPNPSAKPPFFEYAETAIFSPSGKDIAYSWFNNDGSYELRIIGREGGEPRRVYRNVDVEWLRPDSWSPDGALIAATFTRADRSNQLALIDTKTGAVTVLKTVEDWRTPEGVAFTRDGRYIAYDFPPVDVSRDRDVYLIATDGRAQTTLVNHPANDRVLGWFPNSDRLLVLSDRSGANALWSLQVANGKIVGALELIKPDMGRMVPVGFTDDGDFYYTASMGQLDVFTATLNSATGKVTDGPTPLAHRGDGEKLQAVWSPDGSRLLYGVRSTQRNGGSPQMIGVLDMKTGAEQIFSPPLRYLNVPTWAADGRSIVLQGPDLKGRGGLHRVDIGSGTIQRIAEEGHITAAPSPDGRALYFFRQPRVMGTASGGIVARDLNTSEERVVYNGAARFALSPDSRWIAVKRVSRTADGRATGEIAVVPSTGGHSRILLAVPDDPLASPALAWSAEGKFIFFAKGRDGQTELWRVPADGGTAERVGVGLPRIQRVSAHPDGRTLAISGGTPKRELWVVENLPSALVARPGAAKPSGK